MKKYVLGFVFSANGRDLVMISKTKPEWQAGKLNGIGGKIEKEDTIYVAHTPKQAQELTALKAMIREFKEETGVETVFADWHLFAVVSNKGYDPGQENGGDGYIMYCFRMFNNCIFDCKTQEEEKIGIWSYDGLLITDLQTTPSCATLIPMAHDTEFDYAEIKHLK